jgi:hypothetical protein
VAHSLLRANNKMCHSPESCVTFSASYVQLLATRGLTELRFPVGVAALPRKLMKGN